jgi:hypothetical protein
VNKALKIHRRVDCFPPEVRKLAARMIVDDIWPPDFRRPGRPTYADVVMFVRDRGFNISLSAVGRWGQVLFREKQEGAGR